MKKLLALSLLSLAGSSAASANAPFCLPFAALKLRSASCDDNFAIGKQADTCLSAYTNALTAKKKEVEQLLKSAGAQGGQSDSFKSADSVFGRTVKELEGLILSGEQAKFAVNSYGANLSLPEDYDQPQVTGMSTAKYLSVEPCYATPNRVINEDGAVLNLMVEDLKKAKADVLAKSGVVQGNTNVMSNSSANPAVNGKPAPVAVPAVPGVQLKTRDSGVSGIKENEELIQKAKQK